MSPPGTVTQVTNVAIIGDIGGHAEELYAALVSLGAHPDTLELPADLTVIQVGDLVHRGPDSTGVLDIVEAHISGPQWVQLAGNHELNELHPHFVSDRLDESDRARLRAWQRDGLIGAAAAVTGTEHGDLLVTHAGLTRGCHALIGAPSSACGTAAALNRLWRDDDPLFSRTGAMVAGGLSFAASPMWAHAGRELVPSWAGHEMPFSQVHGHSSPWNWYRNRWDAPPSVVERTELVRERRHTVASIAPGVVVIGIDPGLGRYGRVRWAPLVVSGIVEGR